MMAETVTRGEVYQGLLRCIGNYTFDYAHVEIDGEHVVVHLTDDGHKKQVVNWVMEGREPRVTAFHAWGTGGGPTDVWTGTAIKNRHIEWTGEQWEITGHERIQ